MERQEGDEALRSVGGGHSFLQHKDAGDGDLRQNTMPRRLRAHPTWQRGGKKGRVTLGEGGGGGKLRIHRFALNQTKSKIPQGWRCDATE